MQLLYTSLRPALDQPDRSGTNNRSFRDASSEFLIQFVTWQLIEDRKEIDNERAHQSVPCDRSAVHTGNRVRPVGALPDGRGAEKSRWPSQSGWAGSAVAGR